MLAASTDEHMTASNRLHLPEGIQWRQWVDAWDRMQGRYLVRRAERIELLVRLVRGAVSPVQRVLDLGCGTGSLMQPFLDAFPDAEVYGIDFDPVLLPLAQERLRAHGARARLILGDLRTENWRAGLPGAVDAAISATALHWLTEIELTSLYRQLASLLRPGGLFSMPITLPAGNQMCRGSGSRTGRKCGVWRRNRTARIGKVFGKRMRRHSDFRASVALPSVCLVVGLGELRKVCRWSGISRN